MGTSGATPMTDDWIKGYCPMGCGPTLRRRTADDMIVCQHASCRRPTAVSEMISDREAEHVVQLTAEGFTVRHPLRERLDDDLVRCLLNEFLGALTAQPVPDGRYRVVLSELTHTFVYDYIGPAIVADQEETT